MNILKRYLNILFKSTTQEDKAGHQDMSANTAKEKQSIFIKSYLKPKLKISGYSTNGQTWWRDMGTFFIIINLQNFSWNTKNDVNFCFNMGIGLKSKMKDLSKKPTYFDLTIQIREDAYLSESRRNHPYRNKNGYVINLNTEIDDFINELKIDFEENILQEFEKLKTINDCVKYYEKFPFWGNHLIEIIKTDNKKLTI
ncbi:MAG: DUF4304 domain-containing protein [Mucilaginibacter sp.]